MVVLSGRRSVIDSEEGVGVRGIRRAQVCCTCEFESGCVTSGTGPCAGLLEGMVEQLGMRLGPGDGVRGARRGAVMSVLHHPCNYW